MVATNSSYFKGVSHSSQVMSNTSFFYVSGRQRSSQNFTVHTDELWKLFSCTMHIHWWTFMAKCFCANWMTVENVHMFELFVSMDPNDKTQLSAWNKRFTTILDKCARQTRLTCQLWHSCLHLIYETDRKILLRKRDFKNRSWKWNKITY